MTLIKLRSNFVFLIICTLFFSSLYFVSAQVFEFNEEDYFDKDVFDQLQKERKESIDKYNKKAQEFIELGKYEKAIKYYGRILDIDSQDQQALSQKQKLENLIQQNKNSRQDQNTINGITETPSITSSLSKRFDTKLTTTMNLPKKIKLNTHDKDGNELTTTIITLPKNGILKGMNQTNTTIFTYTPKNNFIGTDSFTLKIDNGKKYDETKVIVTVQDHKS